MKRFWIFQISFAVLCFANGLCAEDKIQLEKSYLTGEIVEADKNHIWLKTDFAGTVKIDREKVIHIKTEKLYFIQMTNGNHTRGKVDFDNDRNVNVTSEEDFTFNIPGKDVYKMSP